MTFENYKPKHPKQQHALNAMFQEHGSFYLFGPFGTGKTHLNTASVFRAIQNRIQACMISVPALLKEMRVFGRDSSCSVERLAQRIPYLALDDIGKQKDSDWTDERLFELIDKRYTLWKDEKGHTSITSNLTLTDLSKRIDGATVDRIRGMCKQLFVDGESNR